MKVLFIPAEMGDGKNELPATVSYKLWTMIPENPMARQNEIQVIQQQMDEGW